MTALLADGIQLAWLVQAWVRSEPHLERAVEHADGAFDIDHVWSEIAAGRAQLWPGQNASAVTRIEVYPSGLKSLLFWLCGGADMEEVKAIHERASAWGKKMGCTRREIIGREGWVRALPGYRKASSHFIGELA